MPVLGGPVGYSTDNNCALVGSVIGRATLREQDKREAANLIRVCAPISDGDSIKARITKAAKALGWTYRRASAVWRKEAKRIEAFEMKQLVECVRASIKHK